MDRDTRNLLERTTQQARRLLETEFARHLEGTFDILPAGTIHPDAGAHLSVEESYFRGRLVAAIEHRRAQGESPADSVANFLRECAFTFLNRIVALRMLEARGIIKPSVSKAEESSGFTNEYLLLAPGLNSLPDKGYRLYLESLFDEIGREVGVLFDRNDLAGQLWPDRPKLLELLNLLNDSALQEVWDADETIGWVYQYFNSEDERRQMRADSPAPRNGREMAVRNQFFTPRYVVEFLTENTLGRLWFEMRQGESELGRRCHFMLRRPHEVFLGDPRLVHQRLFGDSNESVVPPQVSAAFQGDLSQLDQAEIGHDRLWIAAAIPPDQFSRLTGELYSAADDFKPLDHVWQALDGDGPADVLNDLVMVWMAISHFALTSSGGPYSIEPFQRLWTAFAKAAKRHLDEQEDSVAKPQFIPYRAEKDPRDIRILDPACGSGHFLLYSYDLLETIYEEAWDAGVGRLRTDYSDRAHLMRFIPELILRHNLHGIDIDSRAAQIGSLALWMRAQRSWQDTPRSDRPPIRRTNIVIAEPMPGEKDLLDDFCAGLNSNLLAQLVRDVFQRLTLAGDAGALLRIETDMAEMVAEARRQWLAEEAPTDRSGNPLLFATSSQTTIFEGERVAADFWQFAEAQLLDALHRFAAFAGGDEGFRRRLFAEDAEHGFAFIDVVRKRYDVALMNPPFGECALNSRSLIETEYNESKLDVFACFVERGMDLLVPDGYLGAITSRQGFFSSLDKWRRRWLFGEGRFTALADLGHKVLDKALVEAAAYVIERRSSRSSFWAAGFLDAENKGAALADAIMTGQGHYRKHDDFLRIPGASVAYWLEPSLIHKLLEHPPMPASLATARVGLQTDDDFRFLRLAWECPADQIGSTWRYFAKGGEYSPYYDDIHLTVNWADGARQMRAFIEQRYSWTKNARSVTQYGRLGLTYPERTTSEFSPRLLPSGTIFSIAGPAILPQTPSAAYAVLALSYTRLFRVILEMFIGGGDAVQSGSAARHYKAGFLNQVPVPTGKPETIARLSELGRQCTVVACSLWNTEESSRYFSGLRLKGFTDLRSWATAQLLQNEEAYLALERFSFEIERLALSLYDLGEDGGQFVQHEYGMHPAELSNEISAKEIPEIFEAPVDKLVDLAAKTMGNSRQSTKLSFWTDRRYESIGFLKNSSVAAVVRARRSASYIPQWFQVDCARQLISYLVGCAFGRWSVQPIVDAVQADLLSPLPAMSPAMVIDPETCCESKPASADGIAVDDVGAALGDRDLAELVLGIASGLGEGTVSLVQDLPRVLGTESVRDFLASGFFAHHVSSYSKSRRKAPIYWQLSIPSKRYSVWLYYHQINRDTFWRVLNDFVKPKAVQEDRRLAALRAEAGGSPNPSQRRTIQEQEGFVTDLTALRDDLEIVAPLWNPNLNDGVLLNFAPLWKLTPQHLSWQRELRDEWQRLCKGEYDWSHIAMHLWPERVVPKCAADRSLAIAHGLEAALWEGKPDGKWEAKKHSAAVVSALVQERSSMAVKASLEKLMAQTSGVPTGRRGKGSTRRNA